MKNYPLLFILAFFGITIVSGCANLPTHTAANAQLQSSAKQGDADTQYCMDL